MDDGDSILEAPSVRGPVELDEVDGLEFDDGASKREGSVFGDEREVKEGEGQQDEFGEFKEGQEGRRKSR